ncbi:hypothetical protein CLG94_11445 [Candidatus Methylomirabilis limnetica]|uniref:Type 4 fimbrial biogenesis protein PilX N-terminal domain-containing protein n=1 Tax=Candidatus Methylomirabilis limnetica TaxID=2033718 RepID=A0A2T4TVF7_9BACT|nr:hypothetical protein [Candidatus Methylomirabilis limnetica]PTL35091.1 hypothetical protein CLG94_11445 [Candidatus Methylomirabilis limnetica]
MRHKRFGDNRGVALPLALMAFVVLGALSAALLAVGSSEVQIASNHLRGTQAFFLAEAGLEHTFNRVNVLWNTSRASLPTNAAYPPQPVPGIEANTPLGGAGNYTVQYQAAGLWTWRVVSTGVSAIGGSQQIRRAVMSTFYQSRNAIVANGDLTIGGSSFVSATNGQCGNVHSNGDLTLGGNTTILGYAAEADNGDPNDADPVQVNGGSVNVTGGIRDHAPTEPLPHIDPAGFLADLKTNPMGMGAPPLDHLIQMKANGEVLDGSDALITTLADNGSYCGWTYTSGTPLAQWTFNDNTVLPDCNGTYYLEGNATVVGSPGSDATPWKTTLIATGDIDIQGKPTIQADANYTVSDTLFYSGRDIEINGTPSNGYNGVIAAHEQFYLHGNGTFTGFIVGENAPNTVGSLVNANNNIVSGNIGLTYKCDANPPLQGPLRFLSWGL